MIFLSSGSTSATVPAPPDTPPDDSAVPSVAVAPCSMSMLAPPE